MVSTSFLLSLASYPSLSYLNLGWCLPVTDFVVTRLASLQCLTYLNLSWCYNISEQSLPSLGVMTQLQTLKLSFCPIYLGISHLKSLVKLRVLNLEGCARLSTILGNKRTNPESSSSIFLELTTLTNLESLDLGATFPASESSRFRQQFLMKVPTLVYLRLPDLSDPLPFQHIIG